MLCDMQAFSLDPQCLADPEKIATYLTTLEPMAETAHLCIIGRGEWVM